MAKDTEAPVAQSTPAPTSAQRSAMPANCGPLPPSTPSASARPISATGIASRTRREGRSPPAAQEISDSSIGKVWNASSASATGMRATAEYRQ